MSILEFFKLVRKYWVIVLFSPIVCIVICAISLYITHPGTEQSATARIVVNSQAAVVYGHAASLARQAANQDSDYSASAKVGTSSMTISITVKGPSNDRCAQFANALAADSVAATELDFAGNEESTFKVPFRAQIEQAKIDDISSASGDMKFFSAAVIAGLCIAFCIIVIIDSRKRFIKSQEGVLAVAGVPILETIPAKDGNRLLANIRFSSQEDVSSICIISIGNRLLADEVCMLLQQSLGDRAAVLKSCSIADDEIDSYYTARSSDVTLIVVRELIDSAITLEHVSGELKLAKANVVGLVYSK